MRPCLPKWTIFSIDHRRRLSIGLEKWQERGQGEISNDLECAKELEKVSEIVFQFSLAEFPVFLKAAVR